MMRDIRWVRAILGTVAAEIGQIAALFAWVAFYSYVLDPDQAQAAYERHAMAAGPWVSIIAGAFIFYAASRWIARSLPTALALFAVFVLIDVGLVFAMPTGPATLVLWPFAASYATKLLACYLGGRHAHGPVGDPAE